MKSFKNYRNETIKLSDLTRKHIAEAHSEVGIRDIRNTLLKPDEVRQSSYRKTSELYYLMKRENRFTCVVVKVCSDGNFIATAMTTSRPKLGKLTYRKDN